MDETKSHPTVSVQAQFTLPSPHKTSIDQKFDASNCKEAVIGRAGPSKKVGTVAFVLDRTYEYSSCLPNSVENCFNISRETQANILLNRCLSISC